MIEASSSAKALAVSQGAWLHKHLIWLNDQLNDHLAPWVTNTKVVVGSLLVGWALARGSSFISSALRLSLPSPLLIELVYSVARGNRMAARALADKALYLVSGCEGYSILLVLALIWAATIAYAASSLFIKVALDPSPVQGTIRWSGWHNSCAADTHAAPSSSPGGCVGPGRIASRRWTFSAPA
jgi:hypothetical protein